jgi:Inositol hexakisphosphate
MQPLRTIEHGYAYPVQERDFDEFARHIRAAAPTDPLIFNCQLGGGRTTTGTIIGCLVRSFATDAEVATQSTNGAEASDGGRGQAEGVLCIQQVHSSAGQAMSLSIDCTTFTYTMQGSIADNHADCRCARAEGDELRSAS